MQFHYNKSINTATKFLLAINGFIMHDQIFMAQLLFMGSFYGQF